VLEDFPEKREWLDAPILPREPYPLATHRQIGVVDDWRNGVDQPRPVFPVWPESEIPELLSSVAPPISLAGARRTSSRGDLSARNFRLGTWFVDLEPDLLLQLVRLSVDDMHSAPSWNSDRPDPGMSALAKRMQSGAAAATVLQRVDGSISSPVGTGEDAFAYVKKGAPVYALVSWLVERPDGSFRPLSASDAPGFLSRRNTGIADTRRRLLTAWGAK